jgi:hypothetical protein
MHLIHYVNGLTGMDPLSARRRTGCCNHCRLSVPRQDPGASHKIGCEPLGIYTLYRALFCFIMIGLVVVASLGICAARGLRLTTTRVHTRDLAYDSRNTLMAIRPTTGSNPSAKTHAAISQGEENDLFSVRDVIYMATVSLAGKGNCLSPGAIDPCA